MPSHSAWSRGTASCVTSSHPRPSGRTCVYPGKPLDAPREKEGTAGEGVMGNAPLGNKQAKLPCPENEGPVGGGVKRTKTQSHRDREPWWLCGLTTFKDQDVHRSVVL